MNYVKVNDDRCSKKWKSLQGELKEVATFYSEEKETNLDYSHSDNLWYVYTNVSKYITKLLKLKTVLEIKVLTVNENGTITSMSAVLDDKQISFRNIVEKKEGTEKYLLPLFLHNYAMQFRLHHPQYAVITLSKQFK